MYMNQFSFFLSVLYFFLKLLFAHPNPKGFTRKQKLKTVTRYVKYAKIRTYSVGDFIFVVVLVTSLIYIGLQRTET